MIFDSSNPYLDSYSDHVKSSRAKIVRHEGRGEFRMVPYCFSQLLALGVAAVVASVAFHMLAPLAAPMLSVILIGATSLWIVLLVFGYALPGKNAGREPRLFALHALCILSAGGALGAGVCLLHQLELTFLSRAVLAIFAAHAVAVLECVLLGDMLAGRIDLSDSYVWASMRVLITAGLAFGLVQAFPLGSMSKTATLVLLAVILNASWSAVGIIHRMKQWVDPWFCTQGERPFGLGRYFGLAFQSNLLWHTIDLPIFIWSTIKARF